MKWKSVKKELPNDEKRVLVVLAYRLIGDPKGKAYHYWISVGFYCTTKGWKIEVNPTFDSVVYWSKLPSLPDGL